MIRVLHDECSILNTLPPSPLPRRGLPFRRGAPGPLCAAGVVPLARCPPFPPPPRHMAPAEAPGPPWRGGRGARSSGAPPAPPATSPPRGAVVGESQVPLRERPPSPRPPLRPYYVLKSIHASETLKPFVLTPFSVPRYSLSWGSGVICLETTPSSAAAALPSGCSWFWTAAWPRTPAGQAAPWAPAPMIAGRIIHDPPAHRCPIFHRIPLCSFFSSSIPPSFMVLVLLWNFRFVEWGMHTRTGVYQMCSGRESPKPDRRSGFYIQWSYKRLQCEKDRPYASAIAIGRSCAILCGDCSQMLTPHVVQKPFDPNAYAPPPFIPGQKFLYAKPSSKRIS